MRTITERTKRLRLRGAIDVLRESIGRCQVCGDLAADHAIRDHRFKRVHEVDLFLEELALAGLEVVEAR